jgi:hypothetical protein
VGGERHGCDMVAGKGAAAAQGTAAASPERDGHGVVTCLSSHLMLLILLNITFDKLSSLAMMPEMLVGTF